MHRVSSQLTLFLRVAVPTVWFSGIAALLVFLSWSVRGKAGLFSNPFLWVALLVILVSGVALMRLIFWRFYRVDMDARYVYVSNYLKTFRYPLEDIETITPSTALPGRIFTIRFRSKGSFGQRIPFLASQALWQDYLLQHPQWRDKWFGSQAEPGGVE